MTGKQKKTLRRILIAAALFVAALCIPADGWLELALFLAPYLVIGYPVLIKAARNIRNGQVFDENFLMAVASIGALAIGEYREAVAVMLFYQVGELFESYAVGRSRQSIAELMDIRPDEANVERDGRIETVDPETVEIGEIIVVQPGERVSLDGVIVEGESALDTAALTGESVPRDVRAGEQIISGCINLTGVLRVRVEKAFGESTVSKILELVENSAEHKARRESFITRFARYYTPAVCGAALLLAVIPPLCFGAPWAEWVRRALIFLVVSCPCALVISVPLSFFGGIGGASRCGILIKGSEYLESLAQTDTIVFDKTGTLTEGRFGVTAVYPEGLSREALLEAAALAEAYSNHPIAQSLREACGADLDHARVADVREIAGHGIVATVDGRRVAVGNEKLMKEERVTGARCGDAGTHVFVAVDGRYAGCVVIADAIKADAAPAMAALRATGVRRLVMLSGDTHAVGRAVADKLGLDEAACELLPADKVAHMERLMAGVPKGGQLAYVGDGINDAPVLARADVGIAMGALGSDAAIEAADIVLMNDKPSDIARAIGLSKRTLRIVHENIVFALGVKAVVLLLGALGMTNMWAAVFADVGVSVIAILNSMRMLRVGKKKT